MCGKLNGNCTVRQLPPISVSVKQRKELTSSNESAYKMLHNLHGVVNTFSSICRLAKALHQIWTCF